MNQMRNLRRIFRRATSGSSSSSSGNIRASYHAVLAGHGSAIYFMIRSLASWPLRAYELDCFPPRAVPFGAALFFKLSAELFDRASSA
jgi:hypothetical protein